ncbi:cdp-diacylglycerol--serine o-phosphatidyltransferase 1 [Phtheirospermum japonicum]|uniref:CDP-diacylglycerol--serine O-phosphatidyltransferase n=1 Tax=Phtheirospermum japonicum TaxID=374723 RepID=A0A830CX24_9LAMI|nr:cdp-diacylglycerol--serine o-phosphatidyltransferase 1 [Phtheirospermum japonicum]
MSTTSSPGIHRPDLPSRPDPPFSFLRPPRLRFKLPSFTLPSPMTVSSIILLTYFIFVSAIVYDVIVEPPGIGSTQDRFTGAVKPVVFLPGRVNGQYIIEGLSSGFMFMLGGVGIVLLDLALDKNWAKSVKVSYASAGVAFVVIYIERGHKRRDDAWQFMKFLHPDLDIGKNLEETLFDKFVVAHILGWWGKAIMIRNQPLLWLLSIGFKLMELTFRHMLPDFNECWWDSIALDVLICNWFGIWAGMRTVRYFDGKTYEWVGISQQPNIMSKSDYEEFKEWIGSKESRRRMGYARWTLEK